jgi:hypothetical protein
MDLLSQTLQHSAIHGATISKIRAASLKGVKGMAVGFGAARTFLQPMPLLVEIFWYPQLLYQLKRPV